MSHYIVKWEINIEAESHNEAACKALEIQRNPDSIATVFEISKHVGGAVLQVKMIDLTPESDPHEGYLP